MDHVVYPSPILRDSLRKEREPSETPKRVQFDECSLSPSRPAPPANSTPSLLRKKKLYFYDRDSLKSRYKKGSPGTRRHQRWMNEMYLNHDWSDLSESEPDEVDVFEVNEEALARPNFSFVGSYEEKREKLEDFWYGQAASLDSTYHVPKELPPRRLGSEPQDRFLRIPKRTRKQITKLSDSLLLEELERDFVNYLSFLHNNDWIAADPLYDDDDDEDTGVVVTLGEKVHKFVSLSETFECREQDGKLVLYLRDSQARLVAHGVCRYYGLKSESWDDPKSSRRATTVYLTPSSLRVPEAPQISLKEHVKTSVSADRQ
jgi:hypothetical protein